MGSMTMRSAAAEPSKSSTLWVSSSASRRAPRKRASSGTSRASWAAVSAIVRAAFTALLSPVFGTLATRPCNAAAIAAAWSSAGDSVRTNSAGEGRRGMALWGRSPTRVRRPAGSVAARRFGCAGTGPR